MAFLSASSRLVAVWVVLELICSTFCCAADTDLLWGRAARVLEQAADGAGEDCSVVQDAAALEAAVLGAEESSITQVCLSESVEGSSCASSCFSMALQLLLVHMLILYCFVCIEQTTSYHE